MGVMPLEATLTMQFLRASSHLK